MIRDNVSYLNILKGLKVLYFLPFFSLLKLLINSTPNRQKTSLYPVLADNNPYLNDEIGLAAENVPDYMVLR